MKFSKLTLASFLTQAVFLNFAGITTATATLVLEQQEEVGKEEEAPQGINGSTVGSTSSNLRGNKKKKKITRTTTSNPILSLHDADDVENIDIARLLLLLATVLALLCEYNYSIFLMQQQSQHHHQQSHQN